MSVQSTETTSNALLPDNHEPGRDTLTYRIGTFADFRERMRQALARSDELPALASGNADDPALALVDAWATALDVLTFYQERIANEGYLGTATERRSLQELARAVGYELNPGVAAETSVAFTLDDGPGAPEETTIEAGTKVQSVPGPGEQAQIFETIETIKARAAWNALKPALTHYRDPQAGDTAIYLQGANIGLKPGDALLVVGAERADSADSDYWDFRRVQTVVADPQAKRTAVTFDEALGWKYFGRRVLTPKRHIQIYTFRLRAALFGHNAPSWNLILPQTQDLYEAWAKGQGIKITSSDEWPGFMISEVNRPGYLDIAQLHGLNGAYYDYTVDTQGRAIFTGTPWHRTDGQITFNWGLGSPDARFGDRFMVRWTGWLQPPKDGTYLFSTLSEDGVRLWVNKELLIDQWDSHAKRQDKATKGIALKAGIYVPIRLEYFDSGGDASIELHWEYTGISDEIIPETYLFAMCDVIHLDAAYPQIRPDSWLVLSALNNVELYRVEEAIEDARATFNLTGKTTRVRITGENLQVFDDKLRETVVFAQSEKLEIDETPILNTRDGEDHARELEPIREHATSILLDRRVIGLAAGRRLLVTGITADGLDCDLVELVIDPELQAKRSVITFTPPLQHSYRRDSVVIYANVARATHGETRDEVLGSSEASRPFQSFVLRQGPLTYTQSATAGGGVAALTVRVNHIEWTQRPTLYERGAHDRAYTGREGPDGRMIIQFGDGTTGARPPSGIENIAATYRIGLGAAGNLKPDQLRVLLTRPLGVRGVTNPQSAQGGADRDDPDDARRNAPYAALTLDRIVSLRDYEDFARAFAGVAKARADWLWNGSRGVVFITVVGADGKQLADSTMTNLRAAIADACDQAQFWQVGNQEAQKFTLRARLVIRPEYRAELVKAAAEEVLRQAWSLKRRDFGQDVTESEILNLLQSVEGVAAADLAEPYPQADSIAWKNNRLTADLAGVTKQGGETKIQPATLLVLDDGPEAVTLHIVSDLSQPEARGAP